MTVATDNGISEIISETRQRGRPPVMDEAQVKLAEFCTENKVTHRHKLNIHYGQRALSLVRDQKQFSWLVDSSAEIMAGTGRIKKTTILAELGRIQNDENLKVFALEICKLKPTTGAAVAMLRRARGVSEEAGNAEGVAHAIRVALNAYITRHPSTPWPDVTAALVTVQQDVEESSKV